jgi:hypothetical protein
MNYDLAKTKCYKDRRGRWIFKDGFGCLSETTCILEFRLLILLITNWCKTI